MQPARRPEERDWFQVLLVTPPKLTVRNIRAVPVLVPMTYVLGTSAQAVREAPLLLVDLETEEGAAGRRARQKSRR